MAGQFARKLKGSPRRTASKQEMVSTLMMYVTVSALSLMTAVSETARPLSKFIRTTTATESTSDNTEQSH